MSLSFSFRRVGAQELRALIEAWNLAGKPVVLDIETTGLDRFKDTIISAQLCVAGETSAVYVDAEHLAELHDLRCPLVLHNFKFDLLRLYMYGIDIRAYAPSIRDTMLMHHLLDENASHALDDIVQEKWHDNYKETFWARNKTFQDAPPDEQLDYACRDVCYTGLLFVDLEKALAVQGVPSGLTLHVHNFALALYDTEVRGVRVDLDYLVNVGERLKTQIASAESEMRAAAPDAVEAVELELWLEKIKKEQAKLKTDKGKASCAARIKCEPLNWASGQQLKKLIYGELGVRPVERKSKSTGKWGPVLDDGALEELKDEHPVLSRLQSYRADEKVLGSFIEGTLERHVGGVIYPSLNVNGTVGSRISSSDPNLQQLPASGGIRGIYVPNAGHLLIGCDYGQLEVVVAAHYSQDPALLKIIYEGASKHDITAAGLKIERTLAKRINFALGYGATEFKVKEILGCSIEEAKGALRAYWETYAGEKKVIDECEERLKAGLPIVTLFGRQRHFPKTFSSEREFARARRQAYNSLIQSTGGEITNIAYVNVHKHLAERKLGRTLFPIHDELLIEAKAERAEEAAAVLTNDMIESGKVLSVPLGVACSEPQERWLD